MTHTEIYTIKGRKYRYEITNYRVGNKIKHKKKYLGAVEPVNKRRNPNAGRKPTVFMRKITPDEVEALETAKKSSKAFTRDRAKILLFSAERFSVKKIVEKISCENRKVRNAIKEFNKKGIASLQRGKAKGAIPKFDNAKKKNIMLHFSQKPSEFSHHFTTWTLPRLRKHLIDYNIVESISIERLRQILMESGAKLERSKRWQYSPDKDFHKKKAQ